ncbi:hypothetical protein NQ318_020614 [Aromia moschata]|uniref:Uncharacterized protein n=1 Tax=Aromia moschata TaxID=1265417 RepID=A0AAV8Z173_9CUCU|nr:hypothetical protein NQ318_020614 [Aromia moschata]
MDFRAFYLVFFLWSTATSAPYPLDASDSETSTQLPVHLVQMGLGLEKIPQGAQHVKYINFAYNRISLLPPYVFHHNNYRGLHKIELYQNKISNVSQRAFRELRQLKIVDLSGNNITSIEPSTFKSNTKLEKLDLSNNKMNFFPYKPILNSQSLEILILADNRIEQIFEVTFSKLPKLRNLMMDNNIIYLIEPNSFATLKSLVCLSLANTGVFRLREDMFKNQTYPRIIDLTDTPLANKFDPPLRKVKNNAVVNLINIDRYF